MFEADRRRQHHQQQQQRINNAAAAAANDLKNNAVQHGTTGTSAATSSSSSSYQRPAHEIRTSTEHLVQSTTYCLAYKLLTLGDMDFDHRVASLWSGQARNRLNAMAFEYLKATSRLGERGEHLLMEIEKEEDIEKIHYVKLAVWKAQCLLELPTTTLQQMPQTHIQPMQERKDESGDVMMTAPSTSSVLSSTAPASIPKTSDVVAASAAGDGPTTTTSRSSSAPVILPTIRSYYDILAWQKEGWKSQKQVVMRTCIKSTIIAKRVLPFLIGEEKKKIEEEEDEEEEDEDDDDDDDDEDEEEHHDDEMDEEDDELDDDDEEEGDEENDNDDVDDDEIDHDVISDDEGDH